MSTFILIPGGWHGGWYFQRLAEALRDHGHRAYPVTLTGVGDRHHLLRSDVNLDTHIRDVVELMQSEEVFDAIILGHSYAGMVLSGAIDRVPNRIKAAIYSDAYVPEDGQSCFELANDLFRTLFLQNAGKDGFSVETPPGLDPRATSQSLATFIQRLHIANPPPKIRRGYLYLSGWKETPFTAVYERLRISPDWETFSLPVGHNVIADAFDELLKIVLKFA